MLRWCVVPMLLYKRLIWLLGQVWLLECRPHICMYLCIMLLAYIYNIIITSYMHKLPASSIWLQFSTKFILITYISKFSLDNFSYLFMHNCTRYVLIWHTNFVDINIFVFCYNPFNQKLYWIFHISIKKFSFINMWWTSKEQNALSPILRFCCMCYTSFHLYLYVVTCLFLSPKV